MIMRRQIFLLTLVLVFSAAAAIAQTAPPTLETVVPTGGQRGSQARVTLEGTNIGAITGLVFNQAGLSARILHIQEVPIKKEALPKGVVRTDAPIEDKARKFSVDAIVNIAPTVPTGIYACRARTPLGVSNLLPFAVGPFPEVVEKGTAVPLIVRLPATLVGALGVPGETDTYEFDAPAGETLVFAVLARPLGSQMDTLLRLADSRGRVVAENNDFDGNRDSLLTHRFARAGRYRLMVTDVERGSGENHHYRVYAGRFPYITHVFPLGVRRGAIAEVVVGGPNIPAGQKVAVRGEPLMAYSRTAPVSMRSLAGPSVNRRSMAIGEYAETLEVEPNDRLAAARAIEVPSTVNGIIWSDPKVSDSSGRDRSVADADVYRVAARKGQNLVFEVMAQQLGSPLDSVLELLDAEGRPVPRATIRATAQTEITLNDPDAGRRGIRVASWTDLTIDDYVMIGDELLQVASMPTHPDDDIVFKGFRGPRVGLLDTTPRNHSVGTPVYKVEIHPPGAQLPANGMPVFQVNYSNDDGGPRYGGKDSRLHFSAPVDGEYFIRLRDVRGVEGERFAYRLTVREATPDFEVTFDPKSFNVQRGGRVPVVVTAERRDGFDGPIDVELHGLPAGFTATDAMIPAGADTTVLLLAAAADASLERSHAVARTAYPAAGGAGSGFRLAEVALPGLTEIRLTARATIDGREVIREAYNPDPLPVVALAPAPDLVVTTDLDSVQLAAGGTTHLTVSVDRRNGFTGRVPIAVMNMPHGVRVDDVGLNGVMITEQETSRTIRLVAEPWVRAITQPLIVVGRVEVNSPLRNESAARPVQLVVEPRRASTRQ